MNKGKVLLERYLSSWGTRCCSGPSQVLRSTIKHSPTSLWKRRLKASFLGLDADLDLPAFLAFRDQHQRSLAESVSPCFICTVARLELGTLILFLGSQHFILVLIGFIFNVCLLWPLQILYEGGKASGANDLFRALLLIITELWMESNRCETKTWWIEHSKIFIKVTMHD